VGLAHGSGAEKCHRSSHQLSALAGFDERLAEPLWDERIINMKHDLGRVH